ncbi:MULTISPECIES: helix-turn-helix domain-containing protein [Paenibacillus]|uniref:helix-turn-helix domain-containing protein n=1 Tax=Paenibacillus TaxID=44249 RepID=UPI00119E8201|nr:helix-turn-helix transcriptional regulator [Paenibacillus sp. IHBB 10380]
MELTFGEYIRKLREQKGLSLNQLATKSGVSNAQISRIENGLRDLPRPETIKKLAIGLDAPQAELMEKAGYFEGLEEEKKKAVKSYVTIHEDLDQQIENCISKFQSEQKETLWEITSRFYDEDDIAEYKEERGLDPTASIENIKDFIRFNDSSMEIKSDIVRALEQSLQDSTIIKESSTPYLTNEEELFDKSLELTDEEIKEQFSLKVDGRELTDDEYARVIAVVRLERQLQEQKNRRK